MTILDDLKTTDNVKIADVIRSRNDITFTRFTIDGWEFLATARGVYDPCGRCDGTGNYPSISYNGICLSCSGWGHGKKFRDIDHVVKIAQRRSRDMARNLAAQKAAEERYAIERAAYLATIPADVVAFLTGKSVLVDGPFLGSMVERLNALQPFTPNMLAAIQKIMAPPVTEHVGTIGEKIIIEVTIVKLVDIETMYGMSTLVTMRDDAGNAIKAFTTSGKFLENVTEGAIVKVKGTVKAHDDYRGTPQTTIVRIALA